MSLTACARVSGSPDPAPTPPQRAADSELETATAPIATRAPLPSAPAETPRLLEEIEVPGDLPAYVIHRRGDASRMRAVFLAGSCTHPETYLAAFEKEVADHGDLIALQGDVPCPGSDPKLRKWSTDAERMTKRIDAALRAAGIESARGLTLIGYSQGAERAEWLSKYDQRKFTKFVLIASPIVPSPARLSGARAVVTMAGRGDEREKMSAGARDLRHARLRALYIELPSTHHGQLHDDDGPLFDQAFSWLETQDVAHGRAARVRGKSTDR